MLDLNSLLFLEPLLNVFFCKNSFANFKWNLIFHPNKPSGNIVKNSTSMMSVVVSLLTMIFQLAAWYWISKLILRDKISRLILTPGNYCPFFLIASFLTTWGLHFLALVSSQGMHCETGQLVAAGNHGQIVCSIQLNLPFGSFTWWPIINSWAQCMLISCLQICNKSSFWVWVKILLEFELM